MPAYHRLIPCICLQEITWPPTLSIVTAAVLAPLYNWLFVIHFGWGLEGAAAANDCVQATSAILLASCLVCRELGQKDGEARTWHGW